LTVLSAEIEIEGRKNLKQRVRDGIITGRTTIGNIIKKGINYSNENERK